MSGLFLFVTSGRFRVVVMFGFAMTFTVAFVHAFVQDLGFFPTVLGAGGAEGDQGGGGEEGESGFLHERENKWGGPS